MQVNKGFHFVQIYHKLTETQQRSTTRTSWSDACGRASAFWQRLPPSPCPSTSHGALAHAEHLSVGSQDLARVDNPISLRCCLGLQLGHHIFCVGPQHLGVVVHQPAVQNDGQLLAHRVAARVNQDKLRAILKNKSV